MLEWILTIIGALLVLDTLVILFLSNPNAGVFFPAVLGAPLLLYGIFYRQLSSWMQSGAGLIFKWFVIICYLLFFLLFVFMLFLMYRAQYRSKRNVHTVDAIIVLGAGLRDGRASKLLRKRLNTAIKVYQKNPQAILLVSGGKGKNEPRPEASAMQEYLLKMGIPKKAIVEEACSLNTLGNLQCSKEIIVARGIPTDRVVFVTNGFHLYRAAKLARHIGFAIQGVYASSAWYMWLNFYLRETLAITQHIIMGKIPHPLD